MRSAIEDVVLEKSTFPRSWSDAQARHQRLYTDRIISFPLNFGINDPPLPPLIRGVGGIEFVAGIFLIDIRDLQYVI
jgi:hypothetical protein